MLVAHVEQDGVWRVDGGMARVAQALQDLAQRQGAQFLFNAHVEEILMQDGKASGVRLFGGETITADAIVFNGDISALGHGLLGAHAKPAAKPVAPAQRSQSAVTWCVTA